MVPGTTVPAVLFNDWVSVWMAAGLAHAGLTNQFVAYYMMSLSLHRPLNALHETLHNNYTSLAQLTLHKCKGIRQNQRSCHSTLTSHEGLSCCAISTS